MEPPATKHTLTFPGLELHLRKQTVKWQGQPLHLTHLEFFTLAYLARHPGWIFTQEQIYEAVWHEFPEDCGAAVVNIISQLRRKMGPGNPIRTVPPQRLQVRAAFCGLGARERVSSTIYAD